MKEEMRFAAVELKKLLDAHPVTAGVYVRAHGKTLIVGRREALGHKQEMMDDDRLRLTLIAKKKYGLSIRRHTGRWEKVPFSGTMREIVNDILTCMQHIVAPFGD